MRVHLHYLIVVSALPVVLVNAANVGAAIGSAHLVLQFPQVLRTEDLHCRWLGSGGVARRLTRPSSVRASAAILLGGSSGGEGVLHGLLLRLRRRLAPTHILHHNSLNRRCGGTMCISRRRGVRSTKM